MGGTVTITPDAAPAPAVTITPDAPPSYDPLAGAAQATGMGADNRGPFRRAWDQVKTGLASAQPGGGLKPQPTVLGNAAEFAGMAGSTAANLFGGPEVAGGAASAVERAIPSAEQAGKAFQKVASVVGTHPVEITEPLSNSLMEYRKLVDAGGSRSLSVEKLLQRLTDPNKPQIAFSQARDFYSNISRLSADEAQRLTPVMKRAVGQIANELGNAISDVAERGGKLEDFQGAMQEYGRAMRIKKGLETAKEVGTKAALTAAGAGAGTYAVKKILDAAQ